MRRMLLNSTFVILLIQTTINSFPLNENENGCVKEYKLNKTNIEQWNIQPIIPEDNTEMAQYMTCYWKKMGYQKENGEIDFVKLSAVIHDDLKNRFRADCLHIVAFIVDNCRQNIKSKTDGLRAIQMWNCLNIYTENLF